jgi:magnesium-transporting ATPase (P-type)
LAQVYPGVDFNKSIERFVTRYRAANSVIAVLGLLLLGWLFTLIRHPAWTGEVVVPAVIYYLLQMSPMILVGVFAVARHRKVLLQPPQEAKRKATLQRRGLFDFVSPFVVFFAIASYLLFVLFAIYLDLRVYHNTSLSKPCLLAIGSITLVYAWNAFITYKYLYGRKNPLVTHEGRVHQIGGVVRLGVYSSIAVTWWYAIFGTLGQPGLQEWRPFALCVLFVITTLLGLMGVAGPPRKNEVDGLGGSHEVPS